MHRKLNFTLAESPVHWRTHRIMELCDYLTSHVLEPLFEREHVHWNRRFSNFFSFDNGCEPLEPTGTIRLELPPLFAGRTGELESAVLQELGKLGIKTAPLVYETGTGPVASRTLLIRIIENPTALYAPPDVNMSHTRGCLVLRDLLGYQRIDGRYEFSAEDLVNRVAQVTEEKIAACTASPVKSSEGLRRTPSAASMKAIRRCLEEIKQFATWALSHKHYRLAAV